MPDNVALPGYKFGWPMISNPLAPTPADHTAHTTRPGIHYPEDVGMTSKHSKLPFKAKKMGNPLTKKTVRTVKRRKKA